MHIDDHNRAGRFPLLYLCQHALGHTVRVRRVLTDNGAVTDDDNADPTDFCDKGCRFFHEPDALRTKRVNRVCVTFFQIVSGVVVGQQRNVHGSGGQNGCKGRIAFEVPLLVRFFRSRGQSAFKIHNGQIIRLKMLFTRSNGYEMLRLAW